MLKFTSHLSNHSLVLARKTLKDGSYASLIVLEAPRRGLPTDCFVPPPPPPKRTFKSKTLWGLAGATLLTGAAVVYAKNSPDTRNWLSRNTPWADRFVALVYQEDTTYWQFFSDNVYFITTNIRDFIFGEEGIEPLPIKSRAEQDIEKDAETFFTPKQYKLPPTKFEPLYVEGEVIEPLELDESHATVVQTEACEVEKVEVITKNMVELEQEMHENTKIAIDIYQEAVKLCKKYNAILYQVVESSASDVSGKELSSLMNVKKERNATVARAQDAAKKAKTAMAALTRIIEGGSNAPPDITTATKRYIRTFTKDIADAEKLYNDELEKGVIADRYWMKVEAARQAFKEELETLYPGINLNCRTLDIPGDTDLLLQHIMKKVVFLQKEIAELQTVREARLNRAMDCKDTDELIAMKVEDMVNRERIKKEDEFLRKTLELEGNAKKKLIEALTKQQETQQQILQNQIQKLESEMAATAIRRTSEEVEKLRIVYKQEIAELTGKMKALEVTLKERQKQEEAVRKSQAIWAAAEALLAATRRDASKVRVSDEIKALENAAENDEAVKTILNAIRKEVRQDGIVTENALREIYDQMEKTALKVALVGSHGASLVVYFLSWLQSKLVFTQFAAIPKDEIDNLPTDFTTFDTFDIIVRARYHMDHGNIDNALRYINLLRGASRMAASTWVNEALKHLEVKQAAETIMAHATANSLATNKA